LDEDRVAAVFVRVDLDKSGFFEWILLKGKFVKGAFVSVKAVRIGDLVLAVSGENSRAICGESAVDDVEVKRLFMTKVNEDFFGGKDGHKDFISDFLLWEDVTSDGCSASHKEAIGLFISSTETVDGGFFTVDEEIVVFCGALGVFFFGEDDFFRAFYKVIPIVVGKGLWLCVTVNVNLHLPLLDLHRKDKIFFFVSLSYGKTISIEGVFLDSVQHSGLVNLCVLLISLCLDCDRREFLELQA